MIHIELFGLHETMCERVWSILIDLSPMEYTIKKLYNHNGRNAYCFNALTNFIYL